MIRYTLSGDLTNLLMRVRTPSLLSAPFTIEKFIALDDTNSRAVYNHVLRLDLNTLLWELVDNYGDIPGVRMGCHPTVLVHVAGLTIWSPRSYCHPLPR